ncbi:MAG: GAF domain-containing protein [Anaerolineae bacterium]
MTNNSSRPPEWHRLLELGKELMTQPKIAVQQELILQAATDLAGGEATLWLSQELRDLPEAEARASTSEPLSPTMDQALKSTSLVVDDMTMAVPLRVSGSTLGILEVKRAEGPPFSEEELALLQGLATQAAAALKVGRQVALERWRLDQLSLVRTVSAEIASVLDLDELAHRVATAVLRAFGYYYVALFTLEPDQQTLLCRGSAGSSRVGGHERDSDSPALSVRVGQGIVGHVAQTGKEILAGDVSREPHYRHVDALPETKSEAALPLKIKDRVLGVLDVQSDRPDRFDETDVLVLRALADQIAIAVEDASLYSALRRRADQLSAVTEVSRAVASILDLDELLNRVVTLIHEQFGYPFVHLFTVDLAQQKIVHRAGWPPGDPEALDEDRPVCSLVDTEGIVAWVACHGETVLSNDVRSDPRYQPLPEPIVDTRAQLAVPLVFGGEVLGILDVQSDRQGAFGEDDRFVFEALADSVAIAIRNANLYQSERWRRQVADSMRDVAGLLPSGIELDKVLDAILTKLEELLPCDASAIWLVEDETLCLSAVHGTTERACFIDPLLDPDSWLRQALIAERPLIRSAGAPPEPLGVSLEFPPDYSAIAAPLRAGDERLGLLTLVHRSPGRYGSESRLMTAAFASYAAVAIQNARLYQTAEEQAYISTVLLQVAEATQSLVTLDEVLDTVVRLMPMLVGVGRCALFLWDESGNLFLPAGACGLSEEQQRAFDRVRIAPNDVPVFDRLRIVKEPVFVESPSQEMSSTLSSCLEGFESPLLLPLLAHGEVLGAMLIDYQNGDEGPGPTEPPEERMAIMRGIAYQAAAAAENARLLEERQEEAYVSAALLQVAQAVVSLNDLDEILEAIVRITPMLVGVERCAVFLWSDEEEVFRAAQVYGGSLPDHPFAPGEFPLLDAVRLQNELIALGSRDEIGDLVPLDLIGELVPDAPAKTSALLAAPLSVKGSVLGVMLVGESNRPRGFGERKLEIIMGIAQQAAMAVQNDLLQQEMAERERLERELQLAHEIQENFLPERLPDIPGWELAVAWRAARQVAGDFYDVFELPERRLGLVTADVADKGMPAALFMALTRTLMRAAAADEWSPADALRRVNDLLVPDARHGMFVTAVYAILSLETGKLVYASAGHHPPLILRSPARRLQQLDRGGTALGVLKGIQFQEHVNELEPGDYMILYTDGITEALSPEGVFYGEERLRNVIQAPHGEDSAEKILNAVLDSVAALVGDNPPSDDLTLMVVGRQEA